MPRSDIDVMCIWGTEINWFVRTSLNSSSAIKTDVPTSPLNRPLTCFNYVMPYGDEYQPLV